MLSVVTDEQARAELATDLDEAMVFKLLEVAEGRWRAVNGPHLVALVGAGARFERGKLVERAEPDHHQQQEAAA